MPRTQPAAEKMAAQSARQEAQYRADLAEWAQHITRDLRPAHETPEGQEMLRILRSALAPLREAAALAQPAQRRAVSSESSAAAEAA
ncbi:MAG: hypothetical protein ABW000_07135 [Actinoplanes sp.]